MGLVVGLIGFAKGLELRLGFVFEDEPVGGESVGEAGGVGAGAALGGDGSVGPSTVGARGTRTTWCVALWRVSLSYTRWSFGAAGRSSTYPTGAPSRKAQHLNQHMRDTAVRRQTNTHGSPPRQRARRL